MKEQLDAATAAIAELMAIPEGRWLDGESSAEWMRRALRRERALAVAEDALRKAHSAVSAVKASCCVDVQDARAAVLEDAARGEIQ